MSAAPRLHPVVTAQHELVEDPARKLDELQWEIARHLQTIRGQAIEIGELRRDRDQEAREHPYWPQAVELFEFWKTTCDHPKSKWNEERFWLVLPFLRPEKGEAEELPIARCKTAIKGLAFDHYTKVQKNGRLKHYSDWSNVFGSTKRFEDMLGKAPQAWLDKLAALEAGNETAAPRRERPSTPTSMEHSGSTAEATSPPARGEV